MLPSDHFVRFYNEVFKFLDERNALEDYYRAISRHQELHCLELFRREGLKGMYDYWEHIRIEENCDLELTLNPDSFIAYMRRCPSLSKVVDNDAGPCLKYCFHCAGWILPLMTKCGYFCVFDLIDPTRPECSYSIFPTAEAAKAHREKLIAAGHKPEYIQTNIPGVE